MMMKKFSAVLCIGLAMGLSASAVLVVDFTDAVGRRINNPLRSSDISTTTKEVWHFSDTIYLSEYTAAGNTNTAFCGGLVKTVDPDSSVYFNNQEIFLNHMFRLRYSSASGTATNTKTVKGAIIWKKDDFLSNSSEPLRLTTGDSLALNLQSVPGSAMTVRMVVKQGGVYYASSSTAATDGLFTITDFAAETWGILDTTHYSVEAFRSLTLDDVEAVGFAFDLKRVNGTGTSVLQMGFDDFQADGTVGAKPATLGLITYSSPGRQASRRF